MIPLVAAPGCLSSRSFAIVNMLAASLAETSTAISSRETTRIPSNSYGQEIKTDNVATAKMNAFIHGMRAELEQGNTMRLPRFPRRLRPPGAI